MNTPPTSDYSGNKRKLKAHTKSRAGCRNCKIRKVKCDESKPECKRCRSYGVSCNYGIRGQRQPDLSTPPDRLSGAGVLDLQRCSSTATTLGILNRTMVDHQLPSPGLSYTFRFELEDLNRLDRFQTRTVLSLGTSITGKVYQDAVMKLVYQYPYLMHAVMTITVMHDRYLQHPQRAHATLTETYHYGQAATLFRKTLSTCVPKSEHDALWATCAILGTISFFAFDALTPDEAWPMKSSPTDLEYLQILEGIHAVWQLIKPTRAGSLFEKLADDQSKRLLLASKDPEPAAADKTPDATATTTIPDAFIHLCELNNSPSPSSTSTSASSNPASASDENPYHTALSSLAPLLTQPCTQDTFLGFLSFTASMTPSFKSLLRDKEPRALLVLAYWYAKLCGPETPWFMRSRATLECQAICMYLERYHRYHKVVLGLLGWVRRECGLDGAGDGDVANRNNGDAIGSGGENGNGIGNDNGGGNGDGGNNGNGNGNGIGNGSGSGNGNGLPLTPISLNG